MVKDLRDGVQPKDDGTETMLDAELNKMSYPDFEGLCKACAKLTVKLKDKMLDVVFWGHITAMVGAINLYMSSELLYTWWEASLVVSKSQGQGPNHAWNIHTWIHCYLHHQKLPLHRYGTFSSSILNDEDFTQRIQLHLLEVSKNGHVYAQDIVDYVSQPEVQESLGMKKRKGRALHWACNAWSLWTGLKRKGHQWMLQRWGGWLS